jgi:hypothetical protein
VPDRGGRRASRADAIRALAGNQQGDPILGRQLERLSQAAQRVEMRIPACPSLQVGDPAHTESGPVGQRLLSQSRGRPVLPEQVGECAPP